MKMAEALSIIKDGEQLRECPPGFMVSFDRRENGMLVSDHFPDRHAGEPLIETEEEGWELAKKFDENAPSRFVNIYVVKGNFVPVDSYKEKKLRQYPDWSKINA